MELTFKSGEISYECYYLFKILLETQQNWPEKLLERE